MRSFLNKWVPSKIPRWSPYLLSERVLNLYWNPLRYSNFKVFVALCECVKCQSPSLPSTPNFIYKFTKVNKYPFKTYANVPNEYCPENPYYSLYLAGAKFFSLNLPRCTIQYYSNLPIAWIDFDLNVYEFKTQIRKVSGQFGKQN
jgi:hypothetical protein